MRINKFGSFIPKVSNWHFEMALKASETALCAERCPAADLRHLLRCKGDCRGITQLAGPGDNCGAFHDFRQFADYHLGDAVAALDDERLSAEIVKDHFDFSAEISIDCARGVGHSDVMFCRKSAEGTDLSFIARGELYGKTTGIAIPDNGSSTASMREYKSYPASSGCAFFGQKFSQPFSSFILTSIISTWF